MSSDALSVYSGKNFILVGEYREVKGNLARIGVQGSTGNRRLNQMLEHEWELQKSIPLPTWFEEWTGAHLFRRCD